MKTPFRVGQRVYFSKLTPNESFHEKYGTIISIENNNIATVQMEATDDRRTWFGYIPLSDGCRPEHYIILCAPLRLEEFLP